MVVTLQVPVGNIDCLGYMGAEVVGTPAGVTFSEFECPSINAAAVSCQKDIGLEGIGAVEEFDWQNFKVDLQTNIGAACLGFNQIGDTPGK
jgi:hypothetical protein